MEHRHTKSKTLRLKANGRASRPRNVNPECLYVEHGTWIGYLFEPKTPHTRVPLVLPEVKSSSEPCRLRQPHRLVAVLDDHEHEWLRSLPGTYFLQRRTAS